MLTATGAEVTLGRPTTIRPTKTAILIEIHFVMTLGDFIEWSVRRPKPRPLATASAIGLKQPDPSYFKAARFRVLDFFGISYLVRGIYLDEFYKTVDQEYGDFQVLPFATEGRAKVNPRLLAAIRTVAAFSAWERVSWAVVEWGFRFAFGLAFLAATLASIWYSRLASSPLWPILVLAFLSVFAARWLALAIPRRWPMSAVKFIVLSALAVILWRLVDVYFLTNRSGLHFYALPFLSLRIRFGAAWCPSAFAMLIGPMVLFGSFAMVLCIAAVFFIQATSRRISLFPEEEIIESIAVLLNEVNKPRGVWRRATERAKTIDALEWIARRLEREYVQRYIGADPASDSKLQSVARSCAARFRAQKQCVVFPSEKTHSDLVEFLWDCLQNATLNKWQALSGEDAPAAAPSLRERILITVRTSIGVIGPAGLALAFFSVAKDVDSGIRTNVLITGVSWSALCLLAMLNPRQFEAQAAAAKSLGELFKKG